MENKINSINNNDVETEESSAPQVEIISRLQDTIFRINKLINPRSELVFSTGDGAALSIMARDIINILNDCLLCLNYLAEINPHVISENENAALIRAIVSEIESVAFLNSPLPLIQAGDKWLAIKSAKLLDLIVHLGDFSSLVLKSKPDIVKILCELKDEKRLESIIGKINPKTEWEVRFKNAEREAVEVVDSIKKLKSHAFNVAGNMEEKSLLIDAQLEKLKDVDSHFATANSKITDLLASASRVGLARSFALRRNKLEWANVGWVTVFLFGIAAMVYGTLLEHKLLPALIGPDGSLHMNAVLTRVLFAAPLVWLTWFAARQFGNNARLIEDYAFKESSALAYHGYKNEFLGDQDHETLTVLRKVAAENFGANPTRMLSGQEAASPLHELLEGALKKEGFDKIVTVLNALNPKAKDDSAAKKDDKKDDKKEE